MNRKTTIHATHAVSTELTDSDWFKSSYSGGEDNCVEVADLILTDHEAIAVRDSKVPNGPALLLTSAQFATFVSYAAQHKI